MKKIRVYQLAKELGVDGKVLLSFLQSRGSEAGSLLAMVELNEEEQARQHFTKGASSGPRVIPGGAARRAQSPEATTPAAGRPPATGAAAPGTAPATPRAPGAAAMAPGTAAAALRATARPQPPAPAPSATPAPPAAPAPPPAPAAPTPAPPRPAPAAPTPARPKPSGEREGPQGRPDRPAARPERPAGAPVPAPKPAVGRTSAPTPRATRPAPPPRPAGPGGPGRPGPRPAGGPTPRFPAPGTRGGGGPRPFHGHGRRNGAPGPARPAPPPTPVREGPIELPQRITVRDLAGRLGVPATTLIKQLLKRNVLATITQEVPFEVAETVAQELGFTVERPRTEEERLLEVMKHQERQEDGIQQLPRPPVVTIMGHVDHGKTTLLDVIRKTRVAAGEPGGITQHIGAYQAEVQGRRITFLDTPGHEAFTAMRSRGAQVTDVAVLVVAADDGVMPQTVEAINHAKAAGVPIVVALNKVDKPNANPDRVKQELAEAGLVPEDWGGDTVVVPVSALRKEGIDELLEMILLVADLRELKANPDRPAVGTVIEAELDRGRGPVATVLVREGTLRVGDPLMAGYVTGRVRAMLDHQGKSVESAGPATPVVVLGLNDVPQPGDVLMVTPDEETAKRVAQERLAKLREEQMRPSARMTLDALSRMAAEGETRDLNLVLKADVQGSLEALRSALSQLSNREVKVQVIHGAVGGITEADVNLAAASNAVIIGFNVRPDTNARRVAERDRVDIRTYRIIYEAIDDVKAAMSGLLKPRIEERVLGHAEVRATFRVPNVGTVAGCYVTDGKLTRNAQLRILRDQVVIFEGRVSSLKRFKDDVREVAQGFECGVGVERFNDIKEGDVIEAFESVEVRPSAPAPAVEGGVRAGATS